MDEPCGGTLRFSGHWILTNVFVTQADILTSAPSTKTSVQASPAAERSPTDSSFTSTLASLGPSPLLDLIRSSPSFARGGRKYNKSHSFGRILSPGHCRRKNALPVSYYALFQGIAASKRTSWLFQHSHILFHLAFI